MPPRLEVLDVISTVSFAGIFMAYPPPPCWLPIPVSSTCTRYTRLTLSTNRIRMKMNVIW
jgi:hypothetical protein